MSIRYSVSLRPGSTLTGDKAFYAAKLQSNGTYDLKEFAQHISDHNCPYDRGDVQAILIKAISCIHELCVQGYRVSLDELGTFYPAITDQTVVYEDEYADEGFDGTNVTDMDIRLQPGSGLKDIRSEVSLVQTLTQDELATALQEKRATAISLSALSADDAELEMASDDDSISNTADTDDSGDGSL